MRVDQKTLEKNLLEPKFLDKLTEDSQKAVKEVITKSSEHPLQRDRWIYRIIVITFGGSLLTMIVFMCIQLDKRIVLDIPDVFVSTISSIIGAIAGMLAPSPIKNFNN